MSWYLEYNGGIDYKMRFDTLEEAKAWLAEHPERRSSNLFSLELGTVSGKDEEDD